MLVLLENEDRKGSDISILNFTLAFGICLEDSSVFALLSVHMGMCLNL